MEENIEQKPGKCCLLRTKFVRLKGHIYYCKSGDDGYLEIWQTPQGKREKKADN